MIKAFRNTEINFKDGGKTDLRDLFYDHYSGFIAFAGRYIADQSVCEDIVQDAFIAFWEKHRSFQSLLAVKAFFYTSIRNACLDHIKHHQVEQKYFKMNGARPDETGSYLDDILRLEAYNQVYREVNKLPEMEKKVLLLALEEKSNDEIAITLRISVNTVRTHKARAYKVLRQHLGDLFLFFIALKKL